MSWKDSSSYMNWAGGLQSIRNSARNSRSHPAAGIPWESTASPAESLHLTLTWTAFSPEDMTATWTNFWPAVIDNLKVPTSASIFTQAISISQKSRRSGSTRLPATNFSLLLFWQMSILSGSTVLPPSSNRRLPAAWTTSEPKRWSWKWAWECVSLPNTAFSLPRHPESDACARNLVRTR